MPPVRYIFNAEDLKEGMIVMDTEKNIGIIKEVVREGVTKVSIEYYNGREPRTILWTAVKCVLGYGIEHMDRVCVKTFDGDEAKCPGCNWRVSRLYYFENSNPDTALCASCFMDMIVEEGYKVV